MSIVTLVAQDGESYDFVCHDISDISRILPKTPGVFCYANACSDTSIVYIGSTLDLSNPQASTEEELKCIQEQNPSFILIHECPEDDLIRRTDLIRYANSAICGIDRQNFLPN